MQQNGSQKTARALSVIQPTTITHVFDYESNSSEHQDSFIETFDKMKEAMTSGKTITYKSGYSNFAFELWIVLHKADCNRTLSDRSQYLAPINKAYGEQFESLKQYKIENNFKRVLGKLCLQDVNNAIQRAKLLTNRNKDTYKLIKYKGYTYYQENPSLSIWESVSTILSDCGLNKFIL